MPKVEYRCPECDGVKLSGKTNISAHYELQHDVGERSDAFFEMLSRGYLDVHDGKNATEFSIEDFLRRLQEERALLFRAGKKRADSQKRVADFYDASRSVYGCDLCKLKKKKFVSQNPAEFTSHLKSCHGYSFAVECVFCGMGSETSLSEHERSCRYRVQDDSSASYGEENNGKNSSSARNSCAEMVPLVRKDVQCFYVYSKNCCVCDHCKPPKMTGNFQEMTSHLESEHQYQFPFSCKECGCGCLTRQSLKDHGTICQGKHSPTPTASRPPTSTAVTASGTPLPSSPDESVPSSGEASQESSAPVQRNLIEEIFGRDGPRPELEKKDRPPDHDAAIISAVLAPQPPAGPSPSPSSPEPSSSSSEPAPLRRSARKVASKPAIQVTRKQRRSKFPVPYDCEVCERKRALGLIPGYKKGSISWDQRRSKDYKCICRPAGIRMREPGFVGVAMMRPQNYQAFLRDLEEDSREKKKKTASELENEADTVPQVLALCDDNYDSDSCMSELSTTPGRRKRLSKEEKEKKALRVIERGKVKDIVVQRVLAKEKKRMRANGECSSDDSDLESVDNDSELESAVGEIEEIPRMEGEEEESDVQEEPVGRRRGRQNLPKSTAPVKREPLRQKSSKLRAEQARTAAVAKVTAKKKEPEPSRFSKRCQTKSGAEHNAEGSVAQRPRTLHRGDGSKVKQAGKKPAEDGPKEVMQFFVPAWNRYRCDMCGDPHTQFPSIQEMASHLAKKHKYKYPFTCEFCYFGSSRKASLRLHNEVCRERWPDANPDQLSSDDESDGDSQEVRKSQVEEGGAQPSPGRTSSEAEVQRSMRQKTSALGKSVNVSQRSSEQRAGVLDKKGKVEEEKIVVRPAAKEAPRTAPKLPEGKRGGRTSASRKSQNPGTTEVKGPGVKKVSKITPAKLPMNSKARKTRSTQKPSGMSRKQETSGTQTAPSAVTKFASRKRHVETREDPAKRARQPPAMGKTSSQDPVKFFDPKTQCYVCPDCVTRIADFQAFSEHLESQHARSFQFRCDYCHLGTDSARFLREHKGLCTMRWPNANALATDDEGSSDEEAEPEAKRKKAGPRKGRQGK